MQRNHFYETVLVVSVLFFNLCAICIAETVTLTAGPHVSVSYDSSDWNVLSSIHNPDPGGSHYTLWKFLRAEKGSVQISVESRPDKMDGATFKKQLLFTQGFRGEPAVLIRENRKSIAGRDWLVFEMRNEMRNANTRIPQSETSYFLPVEDGHVTIFVVGEETNLPNHREAIESFFRQIQVKSR